MVALGFQEHEPLERSPEECSVLPSLSIGQGKSQAQGRSRNGETDTTS